jgi:hypothetical protein
MGRSRGYGATLIGLGLARADSQEYVSEGFLSTMVPEAKREALVEV